MLRNMKVAPACFGEVYLLDNGILGYLPLSVCFLSRDYIGSEQSVYDSLTDIKYEKNE